MEEGHREMGPEAGAFRIESALALWPSAIDYRLLSIATMRPTAKGNRQVKDLELQIAAK
jgi:hypothetical protein